MDYKLGNVYVNCQLFLNLAEASNSEVTKEPGTLNELHEGNDEGQNEGGHGGHERYQVFKFAFDDVESAYVVSLWIFIASIAKIGMLSLI